MKLDEIKTIAVIGAGQMGRGIAQVLAQGGWNVLLVDKAEGTLRQSLATIRESIARAVEKGALPADQAEAVFNLIHPVQDDARLREPQLVIEAVPEDSQLKKDLFARLGRLCPPATILASNTSSISISALGAASGRPDRVVGIHFMNPVPVMKLVEVIQGEQTSDATLTVALDLAARIGKVSVVSKDRPGFIVNRILIPMINEAIFALEAGVASAEAIDLAMTEGVNHPVGPLALADRIGLDTVLAISEVLYREFGDPKYRPCPLLRKQVEAGHLGRKTGQGFYTYANPAAPSKPPGHR